MSINLDRMSREFLARVMEGRWLPGDAYSPSTLIRRSARPKDWQGGRPPPRLHRSARGYTRYWPSPPAPATCCWPACARELAGQHRPRTLPTSCVKRWGGCATCGARGQLTVRADSGFYTHAVSRRLPPDECPLLHRHPPDAPACGISSRRYPKMPGRRLLTGWTAPPMWPRPPYTPFQAEMRTPRRYGSSSGG